MHILPTSAALPGLGAVAAADAAPGSDVFAALMAAALQPAPVASATAKPTSGAPNAGQPGQSSAFKLDPRSAAPAISPAPSAPNAAIGGQPAPDPTAGDLDLRRPASPVVAPLQTQPGTAPVVSPTTVAQASADGAIFAAPTGRTADKAPAAGAEAEPALPTGALKLAHAGRTATETLSPAPPPSSAPVTEAPQAYSRPGAFVRSATSPPHARPAQATPPSAAQGAKAHAIAPEGRPLHRTPTASTEFPQHAVEALVADATLSPALQVSSANGTDVHATPTVPAIAPTAGAVPGSASASADPPPSLHKPLAPAAWPRSGGIGQPRTVQTQPASAFADRINIPGAVVRVRVEPEPAAAAPGAAAVPLPHDAPSNGAAGAAVRDGLQPPATSVGATAVLDRNHEPSSSASPAPPAPIPAGAPASHASRAIGVAAAAQFAIAADGPPVDDAAPSLPPFTVATPQLSKAELAAPTPATPATRSAEALPTAQTQLQAGPASASAPGLQTTAAVAAPPFAAQTAAAIQAPPASVDAALLASGPGAVSAGAAPGKLQAADAAVRQSQPKAGPGSPSTKAAAGAASPNAAVGGATAGQPLAAPVNTHSSEPSEALEPPGASGHERETLTTQVAAAPAQDAASGLSEAVSSHDAPAVRGAPETVAHLSAELTRKLEARTTRFQIELQPAGLGRVDVDVAISSTGAVSAAMNFDSAHSAELVRAHGRELHAALEQAGFNVSAGGLSFTSGGGGSFNSPQGHSGGHAPAFSARAADLRTATAEMPQTVAEPRRQSGAGRLDIRI